MRTGVCRQVQVIRSLSWYHKFVQYKGYDQTNLSSRQRQMTVFWAVTLSRKTFNPINSFNNSSFLSLTKTSALRRSMSTLVSQSAKVECSQSVRMVILVETSLIRFAMCVPCSTQILNASSISERSYPSSRIWCLAPPKHLQALDASRSPVSLNTCTGRETISYMRVHLTAWAHRDL
jgi:hypothetical protein